MSSSALKRRDLDDGIRSSSGNVRSSRRSRSRDRGGGGGVDVDDVNNYSASRGGGSGLSPNYSSYYRNRFGSQSPEEYQNLRLSNFKSSLDDDEIRRLLERIFKRYGEMHVKLVHQGSQFGEDRLAYVNFENLGDAKDARHNCLGKLQEALGKRLKVDPAGVIKDQAGRLVGNLIVAGVGGGGGGGRRSQSPTIYRHSGGGGVSSGGGGNYYREDRREMRVSGGGGGRDAGGEYYRGGNDFHRRGGGDFYRNGGGGGGSNVVFDDGYYPVNILPPEEDDNACRTLYVGNLDPSVSNDELRRVFERHGDVEDVDVKRQEMHAYAFVRFKNLDMAAQARENEMGRPVHGYRLTIGYAKPIPSRRVFVGGLGPWISSDSLELEFDRFGLIEKVHYSKGSNHAYILYDSLDAAAEACRVMHGFPLGGTDRKVRVDFAAEEGGGGRSGDDRDFVGERDMARSGGGGRGHGNRNGNFDRRFRNERQPGSSSHRRSGGDGGAGGGGGHKRSRSRSRSKSRSRSSSSASSSRRRRSKRTRTRTKSVSSEEMQMESSKNRTLSGGGAASKNMIDFAADMNSVDCVETLQKRDGGWNGALVLKRSAYPIVMHRLCGDRALVEQFLFDGDGKSIHLSINQRLKLDQPKSDDIPKWIQSVDHCFLLAVAQPPQSTASIDLSGLTARSVPLLVKYLFEKQAAGVVSVHSNVAKHVTGVLYAFPRCPFAEQLLEAISQPCCALMRQQPEQVLLIVVIRGTP